MIDYKNEYTGTWIGVDLDGTLAEYHGWKGADSIGNPIEKMVDRVNAWLENGENVKIITARVSPNMPPGENNVPEIARMAIIDWCKEHIGQELEVVHGKDYLMKEMWDDRCVEVEFNTGISLRSTVAELENIIKDMVEKL